MLLYCQSRPRKKGGEKKTREFAGKTALDEKKKEIQSVAIKTFPSRGEGDLGISDYPPEARYTVAACAA